MRMIGPALCIMFLSSFPSYAALRTSDVAPAFSLSDLNGGTFVLRDVLQSGRSVASGGVVLCFFATWRGPCRKELPILDGLAGELMVWRYPWTSNSM